jgi:hypothetical protein
VELLPRHKILTAGSFMMACFHRRMVARGISIFIAQVAMSLHGSDTSPPIGTNSEQVEVLADQDATLFAEGADLASGSGSFLFIGNIASGAPRRALLRFDLGAIPPDAEILEASLQLTVDRQGPGSDASDGAKIHRVLESWSEGASDGGTGGAGTKAETGDATWAYRMFREPLSGENSIRWSRPGGSYVEAPSASAQLAGRGQVSFESSTGLVADINGWLHGTFANHGWIVMSNELRDQAARRVIGRAHPTVSWRPRLMVRYRAQLVLRVERAAELIIRWEGGMGPFVLQSAANPVHGPWKDEQFTVERRATVAVASEQQFFRVMQVTALEP